MVKRKFNRQFHRKACVCGMLCKARKAFVARKPALHESVHADFAPGAMAVAWPLTFVPASLKPLALVWPCERRKFSHVKNYKKVRKKKIGAGLA